MRQGGTEDDSTPSHQSPTHAHACTGAGVNEE
jgi:hypothetical protein